MHATIQQVDLTVTVNFHLFSVSTRKQIVFDLGRLSHSDITKEECQDNHHILLVLNSFTSSDIP